MKGRELAGGLVFLDANILCISYKLELTRCTLFELIPSWNLQFGGILLLNHNVLI